MYSLKIKEDLIHKLYRIAKADGLPMTELVDQLLRDVLNRRKGKKGRRENNQPDDVQKTLLRHHHNPKNHHRLPSDRLDSLSE